MFDENEVPPENSGNFKFDIVPRTHTQKHDCNLEPNGEDLQKIEVGPKEIDFGDVFKNSEQRKTFWIQNNLRTAIFVSLNNDIDFLKKSYPKSMVIESGQKRGFNLILFSNTVRPNFNMSLKYMINNKPTCTFKMLLKANVTPVTIKPLNTLNKFQFKNEKVYDKVEMFLTQKIDFVNQGNAPAEFFWDAPKDKVFSIEPVKGKIAPGEKYTMEIIFSPKSEIYKHDPEEDLKLNIVNGSAPLIFKASGTIPQSHCKILGEKDKGSVRLAIPSRGEDPNAQHNEVLNFDFVHIGVEETREFTIKNEKNMIAAYSIVNPDKEVLTFKEQTGYVQTTKTILVTIKCKEQRNDCNIDVDIHIRGGNPLRLTIKANIIIPDVTIVQPEFNFGEVSYNEKSILKLTFRNQSKLSARIIVDLKSNPLMRDFHVINTIKLYFYLYLL